MSSTRVCVVLALAACGSSNKQNADAAPADAASFQPAFLPPLPQLTSYGGPVVAQPRLVSVTFRNDARAAQLDTFVASLAGLSSWTSVLAQYGASNVTAMAPVHSTVALGSTVNDSVSGGPSDIHDFLTTLAGAAPDENVVYVLFYPAGAAITIDHAPFVGGEAYHFHFTVAGKNVPYIVAPAPPATVMTVGGQTLAGFDAMTGFASHEIAEAVTDPLAAATAVQPVGVAAYGHIPPAFGVVWGNSSNSYQAEIGDMCSVNPYAYFKPDGLAFYVQHIWSNAAAAAGHDPCQPRPAGDVYPVSAPELPDPIVTGAGPTIGITLHEGVPRTIAVKLTSDRPASGPWQLACAFSE